VRRSPAGIFLTTDALMGQTTVRLLQNQHEVLKAQITRREMHACGAWPSERRVGGRAVAQNQVRPRLRAGVEKHVPVTRNSHRPACRGQGQPMIGCLRFVADGLESGNFTARVFKVQTFHRQRARREKTDRREKNKKWLVPLELLKLSFLRRSPALMQAEIFCVAIRPASHQGQARVQHTTAGRKSAGQVKAADSP